MIDRGTLQVILTLVALSASGAPMASSAAPVTADKTEIAKPASSQDGKYFDAQGNPTYNVSSDGKVDWHTSSGYLRYTAECLRCHGPDGLGSSYAPSLLDSLKSIDYNQFVATVAQGKQDLGAGQEKVMPSLGLDKNVMCYIDDIYVYLKGRSDGAIPRGRPPEHEPKPQSAKNSENSCMGPE